MTMHCTVIGIDVAKDSLSLYRADQDQAGTLANEPRAIAAWLRGLPQECSLAIEATNTYHVAVAVLAHKRGHRVYMIDGYRLSNYRKGIGGRVKNDLCDARLLARYLSHEQHQLQPWSPPGRAYRKLQALLHRRATLVRNMTALRLSFAQDRQLKAALDTVLQSMRELERKLDQALQETLDEAGLAAQARRCQAIEGIGPISAAALSLAFLRGTFRSSDSFIAFLGLDIRVRESGRYIGRRKLTKQGDPEIRRLLYTAAMAASRTVAWKDCYQGYLRRGLKRTEALVILARKLARIAFAVMRSQKPYRPRVATAD